MQSSKLFDYCPHYYPVIVPALYSFILITAAISHPSHCESLDFKDPSVSVDIYIRFAWSDGHDFLYYISHISHLDFSDRDSDYSYDNYVNNYSPTPAKNE